MSIFSHEFEAGCLAGIPSPSADVISHDFFDFLPLPPAAHRATSTHSVARSARSLRSALSSLGDPLPDKASWDASPGLGPAASPPLAAAVDPASPLMCAAAGWTALPRSSPTSPADADVAGPDDACSECSFEFDPLPLPPTTDPAPAATTSTASPSSRRDGRRALSPLDALAAAAATLAAARAERDAASRHPGLRACAVAAVAHSAAVAGVTGAVSPSGAATDSAPIFGLRGGGADALPGWRKRAAACRDVLPPSPPPLPSPLALIPPRSPPRLPSTAPAERRGRGTDAGVPLVATATPFDIISAPALHETVVVVTPVAGAPRAVQLAPLRACAADANPCTGAMSPGSRKRARRALAQPRLVRCEERGMHVDVDAVESKVGGEARRGALCKWLEKRKTRVWGGRPKYAVRSEIARKRARANGRFANTGQRKWTSACPAAV